MGTLIKEADASLVALMKQRDFARVKRANSPEVILNTAINLVNEEHRAELIKHLSQLGLNRDDAKRVPILSDEQWSKHTLDGAHPYLIVGNGNFMLLGTRNDVPNQVFVSSGDIPLDKDIYEDREHYSSIMIAFPESEAKMFDIAE